MREEVGAARALVKQAGARANPRVDVSGAKAVGMPDNQLMVEGMLPLELGGRRAARVLVAGREVELREAQLAERERTVAAEARAKFGEALAEILKLGVTEDLLLNSQRGYRLVVARVLEGRTAPLEQNIVLVEVNRLRSMRETGRGKVEVAMLELKNLMGAEPSEPLKLRGDFDDLIDALPDAADSTARALAERPDLRAARAAESLAAARVEEARAEGRADAEVRAGYQRMRSGFDLRGFDDAGRPAPIEDTFNSVTFGVSVTLPVRDRNRGALESAAGALSAATRRREFLELTVRREVAAAYARYDAAARSMEIYRVGVRGQAGQNLSVIRRTYELGSKALLEYIAEQRRYIELESDYVNSILETYLARVEVARASASPALLKK
jgi:cobalt-zinc-cadmium efflux system outer membrane protein